MKSSNRAKIVALCAVFVLSVGAAIYFAASLYFNSREVAQAQEFYAGTGIAQRPRPLASGPAQPQEEDAIDFDALREIFPNIVGWIQSYGTVINYPIVQGRDNHRYLYHLPDGTRHSFGSIFMDYRAAPDFSDLAIHIFGHDMPSQDKFGSLRHYSSQEYFERHDSMFIFTPDADYLLVLIAGYHINSAFEVPPMDFADADEFYEHLEDITRRSIFTSSATANYGDRLVYLITCTPTGHDDERLILVGKLVEI